MNIEQPGTETLNQAVAVFRDTICNEKNGLQIEIKAVEPAINNVYRYDVLLRLTRGDKTEVFAAEVKRRLTDATIGAAMHQLEMYSQQGMLVTEYVNPKMAERLRELGMAFFDTAGNAYINTPFVHVFVKGNRLDKPLGRIGKTRAFQPTGLKVIFALLCQPVLVNAPYRDIATAAGVALGTVGWVMTDLKEQDFLVDMGKRGRRLKERKRLVDRWVTAYPEQLRPKLLIGRYTIPDTAAWIDTVIEDYQAFWGGEVAAAILTRYLKPELWTIYVKERTVDLQLELQMRKDPNGNVELLKTFWGDGCAQTEEGVAPALLVYADLLATGDPRNIETAKMIYEQQFDRYLRED
jgi:hypothetical protein